MKASALVLWGSLASFGLTLAADGCGGRAELYGPRDGGDDGAGSGSSSGVSGSSSGFTGSSSGFTGSSSGGMDGGSSGSGSGSGSSSGISGSSSGFSGSSSGISGSSSGVSGSSSGGSPNGSIYLEECETSLCGGQQFDVFGQFFLAAQGNGGCTVATSGSCAYYSNCTSTMQNGVSAGTLTVTGPWLMGPVNVTPMSGTNAYQYNSSSPGLSAGQTLEVSASGATVPPFGPVSVVAPQLATVFQPPLAPDGGTTTIPTSTDLVVAWTGGQAGATMIFQASPNNSSNYMVCSWNAADGKDVVPAAMLQPLAGQSGYVFYGQYNVTSFSAGPFAVTLSALPFSGGLVDFQ